MESVFEQRHRLPLGPLVSFFLADQNLDLTRKKTADGCGTARRNDLGLADGLPVETNGQVLFAIVIYGFHKLDKDKSRIIRVARIIRVVNYFFCGAGFSRCGFEFCHPQ